jgi:4-amino-4-deoxy-L-arabinose transferase-like glycosyltransferase
MVNTTWLLAQASFKSGVLPILMLTFAIRLIWGLLVPVSPVSDANMYHSFAQEIAAGRGYVYPGGEATAYWPVGPSALYGAFYALLGVHGWVVILVNLILSSISVAGIYQLGLLYFDRTIARIAALLFAFWPAWIAFTTVPNSELPLMTLVIWAFVARGTGKLPHWARTVLSTALLVAAAFMRPTVLPLIVLLPLLDQPFRKPAQTVLHVILALVVAAILLTPWAERNRALFGEPVLISANFGINLWMGNNPQANGAYMSVPEINLNTKNEVVRDNHYKGLALDFIRENPGLYLRLCLNRVAHSFDRESIGIAWNQNSLAPALQPILKAGSAAYWLAIFSLSLIGVGVFLRENPLRLFDPLVVTPALFAAVALLIVGQDRYHMPMTPFIALFAAFFINHILHRRSSRSVPDTAA